MTQNTDTLKKGIPYMSDVIRLGKRAFAWVTVLATVSWSVGLAAFIAPMTAQAADLMDGDLIKGSLPSVYYYNGGKRYTFPTQKTFLTWYTPAQLEGTANGGLVKTISNAELAAVPLSGNVTYRPGVKMVKITTDPKVYAVGAGGTLHWVASEEVAVALYGAGWASMVEDVPDAFFTNYTIGADINASADFDPAAQTAAATTIAVDMGVPTTPGSTPPAASGNLMISSPAMSDADLVTDAGNNSGGQRAKVMGVTLTAGSSAVQVDKLVLRRNGIATDSDLDSMYLYDGGMLLAEVQSVSKGVATFSKSGGLVTVPANGSKTVWLWVDVNKDASSGITIGWSLASADVTSSATSVSGSASSPTNRVAVVTDLGFLDVANVSPGAANSIDPQDDYDVWKFRLDANSQDMLVESLTLTNVGSVDSDDLQNFELWAQGKQLGSTVGSMTDGTVTFDLTGMEGGGYTITSGQQRQMTLRADIVGGTNRTYRFGVQEPTDIWVKDLNYNVYTVPATDDNSAFAVTQAGGATTINTGSLTQTINADSPTGNVPDGATNVLFAKFNFKASGEPVKVKNLDISCSGSDSTNILKNVKLLFNGSQVGSTMSSLTCDNASPSGTDFSFGNSFKVEAGATGTVEIRGDLTDATIAAGETVSTTLVAGSSNANGTISLTSLSTSAISGRSLTVKSGALTVSENLSLADYSSTRPLGVLGSTNVRLASFVITGGAEPSEVSQIVMKDSLPNAGDTLKDFFENMVLKNGSTMLHSSPMSLTDTSASEYTFNISPNVTVGVGETYVVDVYVDILSTIGSGAVLADVNGEAAVMIEDVVATGKDTGSTTSVTSSSTDLQNAHIATNGSLRVTLDGDAPTDQQLVLGSTDQVLAKFKLSEESNAEDVLIKRFVVADTFSATGGKIANATGTVRNLKLYNGSTLLGTVASLSAAKNTLTPLAEFDLTGLADGGFKVTKGTNTVVTVKTDLTPWTDNDGTSTTHRATIFHTDYDYTTSGTQDFLDVVGLGSGYAISTTNATATSGMVIGSATGATQQRLNGNVMDAVATKLSIAYSDDAGKVSPSGLVSKNSEQTVAILKLSNTANVGGYAATVEGMNLDINQSGISITASRTLKIYKDSINSDNQLATTTFSGSGSQGLNYGDTQIPDGSFTDLEIPAGGSKYVYVTLDTSDASVGANDTLSVGIQTAGTGGQDAVLWNDSKAASSYSEVNGMPLTGRSMSY